MASSAFPPPWGIFGAFLAIFGHFWPKWSKTVRVSVNFLGSGEGRVGPDCGWPALVIRLGLCSFLAQALRAKREHSPGLWPNLVQIRTWGQFWPGPRTMFLFAVLSCPKREHSPGYGCAREFGFQTGPFFATRDFFEFRATKKSMQPNTWTFWSTRDFFDSGEKTWN